MSGLRSPLHVAKEKVVQVFGHWGTYPSKAPELEAEFLSVIQQLKTSIHTNASYPGFSEEYAAAMLQIEQEAEERKVREEKEAQARPLRTFTVTGEFLDEVTDQIQSLIDKMEPYYSQCNGSKNGEKLIELIEAMHRKAREAEAAQ